MTLRLTGRGYPHTVNTPNTLITYQAKRYALAPRLQRHRATPSPFVRLWQPLGIQNPPYATRTIRTISLNPQQFVLLRRIRLPCRRAPDTENGSRSRGRDRIGRRRPYVSSGGHPHSLLYEMHEKRLISLFCSTGCAGSD